jgi:hypothetical protein
MKTISDYDAKVLLAFCNAFNGYGNGSWPIIEDAMQREANISDPESALENACAALYQSDSM